MTDETSPNPYGGDYEWPLNIYREQRDMAVRMFSVWLDEFFALLWCNNRVRTGDIICCISLLTRGISSLLIDGSILHLRVQVRIVYMDEII